MKAFILHRPNWEGNALASIASKSSFEVGVGSGNVPADAEYVIRWGCTANVPQRGANIFNKAAAIHLGANKSEFRKLLQENNLCPSTYFTEIDLLEALLDEREERVIWVVRPRSHMRGQQFRLVRSASQIREAGREFGEGTYFSRKIEKTKEERAIIVKGRVVQMVEKTPLDRASFNWGVGRFSNIKWGSWDLNSVEKAVKAFNLSGLDVGAVDIVYDNERSYILEINSAPEVVGVYSQTILSKCLDHMINNHDNIPIIEGGNSWKNFIHPALSEEAV